MKILVTGGSGFIGSHLILQIARYKPDWNIVVIDDFVNGNRDTLNTIQANYDLQLEVIEGDLRDKSGIMQIFYEHELGDVDAVAHFAALIEAGVSVAEPLRFYENNVGGSINLLQVMDEFAIKRLLFSSTAATYGSAPEVDHALTEGDPARPESPYGQSKLMVEQIIRDYAAVNDFKAIALRYFNAAGSDPKLEIGQMYPKPTHLMAVAIEAALGIRQKLTLFGKEYATKDGTNLRDYIHVEDLASAHVAALEYFENMEQNFDIFNVATGEAVSNLEVVKTLEEIHGEFPWEFGDERPGDPVSNFADNAKIRQAFGWEPKYTYKEAIRHLYEWRRKQLTNKS